MDDNYYQMTKKCVSDTEGLYNVSRVKCEVEMLCNELPLSEVASLLSDLQFFRLVRLGGDGHCVAVRRVRQGPRPSPAAVPGLRRAAGHGALGAG